MTQVCIVGASDTDIRYELLSRETAREALLTYDLREPYENTLALHTVSVGAAVSLCNDLNWYLVRFADDVLVLEPSIADDEWLSRALAEAVRDERVSPEETGQTLKIYGVTDGELTEPIYITRMDGVPDRGDEDTVVVRVTQDEYDG